jgi:hypothetical protein
MFDTKLIYCLSFRELAKKMREYSKV